MAKITLRIFGVLTVLPGIALMIVGFTANDAYVFMLSVALGGGFFLAGAPLLGFARVISLLERIEHNTRRYEPVAETRVDSSSI